MIKNSCFLLILAIFGIGFLSSGCSGGSVGVSAQGGPAAVVNIMQKIMNGPLETSPGGFVLNKNNDKELGVIINDKDGIKMDVEIFIKKDRRWVLFRGDAEVKTPGWIKVYDPVSKKWIKRKLEKKWLQIKDLVAIHFNSPFLQGVTLRLQGDDGTIEAKFSTFGWKKVGNNMIRVNPLFIKLPKIHSCYRLLVHSYTGSSIFKSEKGPPSIRSICMDNDPFDYEFAGRRLGWKVKL